MSIDFSYVISMAIVWVISFIIFYISYSIYKKTEGATEGYKYLSIALLLQLISSSIHLIGGIGFGLDEYSSKDVNEIQKLISDVFTIFGYFYLPIAVLYMSKDMGIGDVDQKLIKKVQKIFFASITPLFIILAAIIPFYATRRFSASIMVFVSLILWVFTIYYYKSVYRNFIEITKNSCWQYLYIAIITGFLSSIFLFFDFILEPIDLYLFVLITRFFMAIGFIFGFFKLAKMVEVF